MDGGQPHLILGGESLLRRQERTRRDFAGDYFLTQVINNVVNQPPAPLGLDNSVFSPALDEIIFRCLEKEPEKRYASAQELAAGE